MLPSDRDTLHHVSARIREYFLGQKGLVEQMRFDEVSAVYGDFGEFCIGLQLPLDALFGRLQL